jgi:hypothetical protein
MELLFCDCALGLCYNKNTKEEFSDLFEMHFIELNKFKKDYKEITTSLDRWISFLNRFNLDIYIKVKAYKFLVFK